MTDITERLRSLYVQHGTDYVQEAADEIERLRAELDAITELNHAQYLALENVRCLAARNRNEDWACHMLRFVERAGTNKAQITRGQVEIGPHHDEIERLRNLNTALSHKANAYVIDNARAAEENDRLTAQITAFKDGWMRVIDTEMVITHMGIAEFDDDYSTAKTKLLRLIDWYVSMRTDPAMNGGWQLVPIEPTPEMLYAAFAADKEYSARMFGSMSAVVSVGAYDHYVAMLAAAPKPEE